MARDKRTRKPLTEEQRAKKRAYNAAYLAAHREENRVSCAAYRQAHPEECKSRHRAYYQSHREAHIADVLARDKQNPAVCRAREARWRKAHPEYVQGKDGRRQARKRGAPVNDFTVAQWRAMQEAYAHRCVYCGKRRKGKLTQDHITPFVRGGSHTAANIVPACRSCNSRKSDGPVLVPVQPLLFVG
jgi:5-methylcytosine-specific restriction endonuclease McrA